MRRVLLVDDEPEMLGGLKRILGTLDLDWEVLCAHSGAEALEVLSRTACDAIVSDEVMPGMDGVRLLSETALRQPRAARVLLAGGDVTEPYARAAGAAHICLTRPCSADHLTAVIERACALRDVVNDAKIQALVGQVDSLPSVPIVYIELVEALKSTTTSFKTVAEIVAKDVAMTAKILQLVNSAFFGFYRNINSVEHAVGILGMRMIRSLVLSVKVFQEYSTEKMSAFPIDALMQHSVSTGALARIIAKSQSKDAAFADDCFMAGMLHDVGKLVLAEKVTDAYAKVQEAARENAIPFYEAERRELGVSHAEVGAYLMGLWGIADNVVEAIAYHHRPSECANRAFGALTVIHVANAMEHKEGSGEGGAVAHEVDLKYLAELGMQDRLDKWSEICHVLTRDER